MEYKKLSGYIGFGAAIVSIIGLIFYVTDLKVEKSRLQNHTIHLESKISELNSELANVKNSYQSLIVTMITGGKIGIDELSPFLSQTEIRTVRRQIITPDSIPLSFGWLAKGSVLKEIKIQNGILEMFANLKGSDDYAEFFIDLRSCKLRNLKRNSDGTYNLVGYEINAIVKAEHNFKGDIDNPNGCQIIIKDNKWNTLVGNWININDKIITQEGMEIFFEVPDTVLAEQVSGLSVKFTIGSGSDDHYFGKFYLEKVQYSYVSRE